MVSAASATQALDQAEALLIEAVNPAEEGADIDLGEFREILSERREALDPPSFSHSRPAFKVISSMTTTKLLATSDL
jgi:hypothetical protein